MSKCSLIKVESIAECSPGIQDAIRTKRLRWYGDVARASSWTNSITSIAIPGPRGRGRPRKSWSECVKSDVDVCNIEGIDPQNREAWRSGVRRTSQLQLTTGTGKLSAVKISNQD